MGRVPTYKGIDLAGTIKKKLRWVVELLYILVNTVKIPQKRALAPNFISFQLGFLRRSFKAIIHQPCGRSRDGMGWQLSIYCVGVHWRINIFRMIAPDGVCKVCSGREGESGWRGTRAIVQLSREKRRDKRRMAHRWMGIENKMKQRSEIKILF